MTKEYVIGYPGPPSVNGAQMPAAVGDIATDSAGVDWYCTVGGTPGTWVSTNGTYVPTSSYIRQPTLSGLAHYRSKLSTLSSSPLGILFDGDSIVNGGDIITSAAQNWVEAVCSFLLTKYGTANHYGDGWGPHGYTYNSGSAPTSGNSGGYAADAGGAVVPFGSIANASSTTFQTDDAIFGRALEATATSGNFQTLTLPLGTTSFDLVFASVPPSGTVLIKVDGGALPGGASLSGAAAFSSGGSGVTYTNHGPNAWGANPIDKMTVSGLAAGTQHTVVIANCATAHGLIYGWLNVYYGTTGGFMFCRNGNAGALAIDIVKPGQSSDYNGRGVLPGKRDVQWTGGVNGISGTNSCFLTTNPFGYPTGCDLIIDDLFINDVSAGVAVEAVMSAKNRKWRAMRRCNPNCSIICMLPSYPDSVTSDDTGFGGRGLVAPRYKEAIMRVAQAFDAVVVDIDAWWGGSGVSLGYQNNGDIHPTATGHAAIAAAFEGIL